MWSAGVAVAMAIAVVPGASAAAATYTAYLQEPEGPAEPGQVFLLSLNLRRSCPGAGYVLDEEDVRIFFGASGPFDLDENRTSLHFDRQVCATQPTQDSGFHYNLTVRPSSRGDGGLVTFLASPVGPAGPGLENSSWATDTYTLSVRGPEPKHLDVSEATREGPGPASTPVVLALAALAMVQRRPL